MRNMSYAVPLNVQKILWDFNLKSNFLLKKIKLLHKLKS